VRTAELGKLVEKILKETNARGLVVLMIDSDGHAHFGAAGEPPVMRNVPAMMHFFACEIEENVPDEDEDTGNSYGKH
jgi:alpha-beta hydrolase superfamily lysophospholipase